MTNQKHTGEIKMSKKKLKLANENIPEDEMVLAKILQNAKARDLGFSKGAYYKNSEGHICLPQEAVYACAVGAAMLEEDTKCTGFYYITNGNDCDYWNNNTDLKDGETIGWAYRQAMTVGE